MCNCDNLFFKNSNKRDSTLKAIEKTSVVQMPVS